MKLRTKILGTILTTLLVITSGLYIYSKISLETGHSLLERREALLNVERLKDLVAVEVGQLKERLHGLHGHGLKDFEVPKLNSYQEILKSLGIQYIFYWSAKGELLLSKKMGAEGTFGEVTAGQKKHLLGPDWRDLSSTREIQGGFLVLPEEQFPLMVAVYPLVKGTLVVGRPLDSWPLDKISRILHFDLQLELWNTVDWPEDFAMARQRLQSEQGQHPLFIHPLNEHHLASYVLFHDMAGKEAFLIRQHSPREVKKLGRKTLFTLLGSITVVGFTLTFVILFLLDRFFIMDLLRLVRQVAHIGRKGDLSLRVTQNRGDEVGQLIFEINRMLFHLENKGQSLRLLLDHMDQGFFTFDQSGKIGPGYSQAVVRLFGQTPEGKNLPELLQWPIQEWGPLLAAMFTKKVPFSTWEQFLPVQVESGEKNIELKYQAVYSATDATILTHILVVATDVTGIRKMEKDHQLVVQTNECLIRILSSPEEFKDVMEQIRNLEFLVHDSLEFKRGLHTLKGSLSYFNWPEMHEACHHWEGQVDMVFPMDIVLDLQKKCHEFLERHRKLLHFALVDLEGRHVSVPFKNLQVLERYFVDKANQANKKEIEQLEFLRGMMEVPVAERLGWLDRVYKNAAEKCGKKVEGLQWCPSSVKVPLVGYEALFRTLAHVVRNSADHGIEVPEERIKKGKPEAGQIWACLELRDETYHLVLEEDGEGLDLEKIRLAAMKMDLSIPESEEELANLIFEVGISTKEKVTDISGRGVGLGALRAEARKLGGDAKVVFPLGEDGQGVRFHIWFPRNSGGLAGDGNGGSGGSDGSGGDEGREGNEEEQILKLVG